MRRPGAGPARRVPFRGFGRGPVVSAPAASMAYGIKNFVDMTNFYRATNTTAPLASIPFTFAVMYRHDASGAGTSVVAGRTAVSTTGGCYLRRIGSAYTFVVVSGAAANIISPALNATVGTTYISVCTYDGVTLRHFVHTAEIGTGTAGTGYTPPPSLRMTIGVRDAGTLDFDGGLFNGMAHAPVVTAPVDVLSYIATCEASADVLDLPASTDYRWSVKDKMSDGVIDTTFEASTGTLDLSLSGTLAVEPYTPFYG